LAQGAAVAYGTVSEPLMELQKWPAPNIYIANISKGLTQIEAAWKSVPIMFQGNFAGDPLGTPYMLPGDTMIQGAVKISGKVKIN
jgi:hypothetical protein